MVTAVVVGLGLLILIPAFKTEPTCTDNKQNGTESGVDCGGSCERVCTFQASNLLTLWSRAFHVAGDRYNLIAYIENQNPNAIVKDIGYEFRLYDVNNKFIALRNGRTSIDPNGRMVIFEPGINVGNKVPKITSFKFTEAPLWIKSDPVLWDKVHIIVADKKLEQTDSAPRLTASVTNNTLYDVPNVEFTAIVYDGDGNAIAASKTYLDRLPKNSVRPIFFTWAEPFVGTLFTTEVTPKFDPSSVTF